MTQIVAGTLNNPMVNQMMHQILVSLSAMGTPAQEPQQPTKKKSNVVHDAICDSCSQKIVGA